MHLWKFRSNAIAVLRLNPVEQDESFDYVNIENSLMKVDGVISAETNPVANTVKIEFDSKRIKNEELRRALRKACDNSAVKLSSFTKQQGKEK